MPSNLGSKLSSIFNSSRLDRFKSKPNSEQPATSSFTVMNRAKPQQPAPVQVPTGWTSSTTSPISPTGHGALPIPGEIPRPGSPTNIQHAQFGGGGDMPNRPPGPLRVTNPDPSRESSTASSASLHEPGPLRPRPSAHPDILTPGMGPSPRHFLTPDLTFERPASQHHQSPSPQAKKPGPRTFAEMGFVEVVRRKKWYNPGTWKSRPAGAILLENVDPRKYRILTPKAPAPAPAHPHFAGNHAIPGAEIVRPSAPSPNRPRNVGFDLEYNGI